MFERNGQSILELKTILLRSMYDWMTANLVWSVFNAQVSSSIQFYMTLWFISCILPACLGCASFLSSVNKIFFIIYQKNYEKSLTSDGEKMITNHQLVSMNILISLHDFSNAHCYKGFATNLVTSIRAL